MVVSNLSLPSENSSQLDNSMMHAAQEPGTEYFVLASALGVIMLLAIFGNATLIATILRSSKLRTHTNMFILNLACADMGVALLCMPFSIITCISRDWIFGDSLCHLNGFMNILFECCSLFTLTAISIEKYFSIVKPMSGVITTRLARLMVAMTWIAALILASIPLTDFIGFDFKTGSTQCGVQVPTTLGQTIYAFLVLLVAYFIPLCIMGFCYVNIFRAARKHSIRVSQMSLTSTNSEISLSSQSQIAMTIFVMFIVFFLCWTPYFTYMVYMTAQQVKSPDVFAQRLGLASYWCAFLNSCIDPFVYGLRNPLIRKQLYLMYCRRFQNGAGSRHNSMPEAQKSSVNCESCLKPPQTFMEYGDTSAAYPAFINFVALSEEDIVGPNAGIPIQTTNEVIQTDNAVQLLSIQDLCNVNCTTEQACSGKETLPKPLTLLPVLCQETNEGSTEKIGSSTCCNACSVGDYGGHVGRGNEEVTCSSYSLEDTLCSFSESDSVSGHINACCCQDGSYSSSNDQSASHASIHSSHINTDSFNVSSRVIAESAKKVSFLPVKKKPRQLICWIESQL